MTAVDAWRALASDGRVMGAMEEHFEPFFFEEAQNGQRAWPEAAFMKFLGYQDKRAFANVRRRAMQACISLGSDPSTDFILLPDGTYKYTRSACFLIAMNGDPRKRVVAEAQAYFVTLGNLVYASREQHADSIDRIVARDEIAAGMKALAATAKNVGVTHYGRFTDAGYRGMYNMSLEELVRAKGVPVGEKLLDVMGRTELAANLFRVTQTDEKIRNENIRGQTAAELAALTVGQAVRETMIKTSGSAPEHLPLADPIADVKRELRATERKLRAMDNLTKSQRMMNALPEHRDDDPTGAEGYTEEPDEPPEDDGPPF